jgi:hypothetical protein
MKYDKGKTGNKAGRPKGAKNKVPHDIVKKILDVTNSLEKQGKGLKDCAEEDPAWFYSNFLKGLIPKNVDLTVAGDLTIKWQQS